jgi:hypothetical protein
MIEMLTNVGVVVNGMDFIAMPTWENNRKRNFVYWRVLGKGGAGQGIKEEDLSKGSIASLANYCGPFQTFQSFNRFPSTRCSGQALCSKRYRIPVRLKLQEPARSLSNGSMVRPFEKPHGRLARRPSVPSPITMSGKYANSPFGGGDFHVSRILETSK